MSVGVKGRRYPDIVRNPHCLAGVIRPAELLEVGFGERDGWGQVEKTVVIEAENSGVLQHYSVGGTEPYLDIHDAPVCEYVSNGAGFSLGQDYYKGYDSYGLWPDGPGDLTEITDLFGAATHWQACETGDEDTSYVEEEGADWKRDLFTCVEDVSYPGPGYPVRGVTVIARAKGGLWAFEEDLPFTETSVLYFSPIIGDEVYIIDRGTNFWKYNLVTRVYTQLASPAYTAENVYRTLAVSPDGTKLACITKGGAIYDDIIGARIEFYNIAGNTWSASSPAPYGVGQPLGQWGGLKSIVWADNDTIWAWCVVAGTSTGFGKCIKYVLSTDTWTVYASATPDQGSGGFQARCAAIKSDSSVVFGGHFNFGDRYCKYTIATDTYTFAFLTPGGGNENFVWTYDKDKLWYAKTDQNYRLGYLDVDAEAQTYPASFPANLDQEAGYWTFYSGISDDATNVISYCHSTNPKLQSYGVQSPQTAVATLLKTHGIVYEGDAVEVTDAYAYYQKEYRNNPYTGSLWTEAEVAALQIGVELKRSLQDHWTRCTNVYALVEYYFPYGEDWFDIWRAGLVFDPSSIPVGATIISAILSLYGQGDTSDTDFDVVLVSGADLADTLVAADYGDLLAVTTSMGSFNTSSLVLEGWNSITLSATALAALQAAINAANKIRFGLRSSRDIDGISPQLGGEDFYQEFAGFYGSDISGKKPKLAVVYQA